MQRVSIPPKFGDLQLEELRKTVHFGSPPWLRRAGQDGAGQDTGPLQAEALLQTASPAAAPTAVPSAAAATMDEPDDEQQHDGADGGVDNRADNSGTKMDSERRQQPVADEGADNAEYKPPHEPKTCHPDV